MTILTRTKPEQILRWTVLLVFVEDSKVGTQSTDLQGSTQAEIRVRSAQERLDHFRHRRPRQLAVHDEASAFEQLVKGQYLNAGL